MSVLREIPFGGRFHRPRVRDLTFEESIDRTRDPLILWHEQRGSPIRDIVVGRVHVVQYSQSSQLDLNIAMIRTFIGHRENWTREMEDYEESERNFAKAYSLCYATSNVTLIGARGANRPLTGVPMRRWLSAIILNHFKDIGVGERN